MIGLEEARIFTSALRASDTDSVGRRESSLGETESECVEFGGDYDAIYLTLVWRVEELKVEMAAGGSLLGHVLVGLGQLDHFCFELETQHFDLKVATVKAKCQRSEPSTLTVITRLHLNAFQLGLVGQILSLRST